MSIAANSSLESVIREVAAETVRITVRAQPSASRSSIVGLVEGASAEMALKIALAAPPVDGAANDELVRMLARWLGVARSTVTVVRGQTGRAKVVEVSGISRTQAMERLFALMRHD